MFEPVHGSAPDIAGTGIVNPLAAILSAGQMLDHFGLAAGAAAIDRAVRAVLAGGSIRTPDLGGSSTTADVTAGGAGGAVNGLVTFFFKVASDAPIWIL